MSTEPKIKPLDEEIMLVQLEGFTSRFDNEMAKDLKKSMKWVKLAFVPYGVCIGASLITQNMIPLIAGTTYVSAITIIKIIKDGQDFEKKLERKYNPDPNITYIGSTEPDFDFLNQPIIQNKGEDYFSDDFIKIIEEPQKPQFTIVGKESQEETNAKVEEPTTNKPLDKDETMSLLVSEYRTYSFAYKLPRFKVTNKEWDILFDTMYDRLKELSLEDRLYELMSFTQRYVFADSLVNKRKEITIQSYLNQLPMLEKVGLADFGIDNIVSEIRSKLSPPKTIILDIKKLKKQK